MSKPTRKNIYFSVYKVFAKFIFKKLQNLDFKVPTLSWCVKMYNKRILEKQKCKPTGCLYQTTLLYHCGYVKFIHRQIRQTDSEIDRYM